MSADIMIHQYADNGYGYCYECAAKPGGTIHDTSILAVVEPDPDAKDVIWLYDEAGGNYHADTCPCLHHCGNCHENLLTAEYPNRATRYCSENCQDIAARVRAQARRLRG